MFYLRSKIPVLVLGIVKCQSDTLCRCSNLNFDKRALKPTICTSFDELSYQFILIDLFTNHELFINTLIKSYKSP